jgi:hypothetical protein
MSRLKKIKLYTHQFLHMDIRLPSDKAAGGLLFRFFYFTGLNVIKGWKNFMRALKAASNFAKPVAVRFWQNFSRTFAEELDETKILLPKRLKLVAQLNFSKAIAAFLILATVSFTGLKTLRLLTQALQLKTAILNTGLIGGKYLSQAKTALLSRDFSQANNKFSLAYKTFAFGQAQLGSANVLISQLAGNLPSAKNADNLLSAAQLLSQSGSEMAELLAELQNISITAQGLNYAPDQAQKLFANINKELDLVNSYLARAGEKIVSLDSGSLPQDFRQKMLEAQNQFLIFKTAFDNFYQALKLGLQLNSGKKHVLLLFENNNELRPTGGFMGTFGSLYLNYGKLGKMEISSIYDLDGQLMEKIVPPSPVLNVNDRWFLRDSNWFADFPTSAQKISSFYEKEGGETPDLVIALTPNLIVDFLKTLGPIHLPKYGLQLNADNFIEQTQLVSSVNYATFDSFENKPKQLLADFFPLMLQKIGQASPDQTLAILQALENNLKAKQILLFSPDNQIQSQLAQLDWTGAIAATDRDFLTVNISNLGGTKTDLFVDQNISLKSAISSSGEILNELTITRTNKLPKMDKTENTSFLRIYAPLGSTLISNVGFDKKNLEASDDKSYKIDPDVYQWEKDAVKDVLTGTLIGKETGKTIFGNWLTVQGGETRTVTLIYRLPFKISDLDHYSLLLQKQPGTLNQNFRYRLEFPGRKIQWQNFNPETLETDYLETSRPLDQDSFFGEVLTER